MLEKQSLSETKEEVRDKKERIGSVHMGWVGAG